MNKGANHTELTDLINSMKYTALRFKAYKKLITIGSPAIPALREGLKSDEHQVRKWCAMCLDQVSDEATLNDLLPLLEDSNSQVRLWAVHTLACEHCKPGVKCAIDLVPLLVHRVRKDNSLRVRRMAVIMLTTEFEDPRVIPVLKEILKVETDRKLRLHAARGLNRMMSSGAIN